MLVFLSGVYGGPVTGPRHDMILRSSSSWPTYSATMAGGRSFVVARCPRSAPSNVPSTMLPAAGSAGGDTGWLGSGRRRRCAAAPRAAPRAGCVEEWGSRRRCQHATRSCRAAAFPSDRTSASASVSCSSWCLLNVLMITVTGTASQQPAQTAGGGWSGSSTSQMMQELTTSPASSSPQVRGSAQKPGQLVAVIAGRAHTRVRPVSFSGCIWSLTSGTEGGESAADKA